jgi:hypothetical protein
MPLTRRKEKLLDDEECFDLWLKLGSLQKVANKFENDGRVNEITGKPFTRNGIRFSALRYLIHNSEECRQRMTEYDPNSPYMISDDAWYTYLAKRARDSYYNHKPEALYRWAEKYDIDEKYINRAVGKPE